MSKIGKKPILIPAGIEIKIDDRKIFFKSSRGELIVNIPESIITEFKDNKIFISTIKSDKEAKIFWGLTRSLAANAVKGLSEGFQKKMEIQGVGYRAAVEENDIVLQMGFTHPVRITAPPGVNFLVEKNIIIVSGVDKAQVSKIADIIRRVKPPEPYKGKGIRYEGEVVRRKLGKKAVASSG